LGIFWKALECLYIYVVEYLEYFTAIWHILWPFGIYILCSFSIYYVLLEYIVAIWYIGITYVLLEYIVAIWYTLWPFGMYYGNLVYIVVI
jgi:hypothetical protein